MSTLLRRVGNVYDMTHGGLRPPSTGHKVLVLKAGGIVSTASTGSTLTLYPGHSFEIGSKIMLGSDTATFSGIYTVDSTTSTTITMSGGTYATSVGDRVLQLGPDSGTSTPNWDGSTVSIYSTPDTTTAIDDEQALVDSGGEYGYWHNGQNDLWEVVLSPNADVGVVGINVDAYQANLYSVRFVDAYGAIPDNVTDSTAEIQAAIDDVYTAGGGEVRLSSGRYVISAPLILKTGVHLIGVGTMTPGSTVSGTTIKAGTSWSGTAMLTTSGGSNYGYGIVGLRLIGRASVTNGILLTNDKHAILRDVTVDTCQGAGVKLDLTSGSANSAYLQNVWVQNACQAAGLGARTGAIEIDWTDCYLVGCTGTSSSTDYSEGGNRVGLLISGSSNFLVASYGQVSEDGVVITGSNNNFAACRADLNRGHGFVITGSNNILNGCMALSNSQQTTNTYDGFTNSSVNNIFIGCLVRSVTNTHRYAFRNTSSTASRWTGCDAQSTAYGTALFENATFPTVAGWECNASLSLTAAADDTTPSVRNARFLATSANTGATAITQLDDAVCGQIVTIRCGSSTNASTIADSGNFTLNAAWTPDVSDTLTVYTTNGTTWFELCRSAN